MKEYIERAAAMESIIGLTIVDPAVAQYANAVYYNLQNLPAADVAPVRHGRWGEYESFPLTSSLNGHPCSECGMHFSTLAIPVMKYCPNCGARMDKEDKHEAD